VCVCVCVCVPAIGKTLRLTALLSRPFCICAFHTIFSLTIKGGRLVRRRVQYRKDICVTEVPLGARVMGHPKPHP